MFIDLDNKSYLIRQATEQDLDLLERLFTENMKGYVERENIYLAEIQICSEYQNRGIGTELLKSIIQQFGTTNRIWLKVIKGNPAINLYRRLGFKVFAESKTHLYMELLPQASN